MQIKSIQYDETKKRAHNSHIVRAKENLQLSLCGPCQRQALIRHQQMDERSCADPRIFVRGEGVPGQTDRKSSDVILALKLYCRGVQWLFKRKISLNNKFPRFQEVQYFPAEVHFIPGGERCSI